MADGTCPLCRSSDMRQWERAHGRTFLRCGRCDLVGVPPHQRLHPDAERAHYGMHRNDPSDPRYRAFLDRLAIPLTERLPPGAVGLDYGSGPGPTLSVMLGERGFPTAIYDPFFARDPAVLARTYDFITCTEAAEHFFDPAAEFDRLDRLLAPGGWLALMTEIVPVERAFADWRYARDPTHVSFYTPATMAWLAARYGWRLESPRANVALFRKPPSRGAGFGESGPGRASRD